jgi:Ca2+-binding RTX toxin-like protein
VRRLTMLTLVVGTMILALSSGVALADHFIKGTDGNDVLRGTEDADYVEGRKGDDKLFGYGGDGANFSMEYGGLFAGYGDDVVYGGDGDDLLYGDQGADRLYGEAGNDEIWAKNSDSYESDGGEDLISGGNGDDSIWAYGYPARKDLVRCGAGSDSVIRRPTGRSLSRLRGGVRRLGRAAKDPSRFQQTNRGDDNRKRRRVGGIGCPLRDATGTLQVERAPAAGTIRRLAATPLPASAPGSARPPRW